VSNNGLCYELTDSVDCLELLIFHCYAESLPEPECKCHIKNNAQLWTTTFEVTLKRWQKVLGGGVQQPFENTCETSARKKQNRYNEIHTESPHLFVFATISCRCLTSLPSEQPHCSYESCAVPLEPCNTSVGAATVWYTSVPE
jgi:hypothetical protein